MKSIKLMLYVLLLISVNCLLFKDEDPPPDPDPFIGVNSKDEIIGEWVCYQTHLIWKDGRNDFYLDKEKEEDVVKIDSARMFWRFLRDGTYYEYNFQYLLDSGFFCKDSAFSFTNYPFHHNSEPFGDFEGDEVFRKWAVISRNSTDLRFRMVYDNYSQEISIYTKKTW